MTASESPTWTLYLIRTRHGDLYTGITTDVERRFAEHQVGGAKAARYLRGRGPLELVFCQQVANRSAASKAEWRVKRLPKADKEALVSGQLPLEALLSGVIENL
jgi:putative endonuclease